MKRAAIFIGVDMTGGLPVLKYAAKGAKRIAEEWAKTQPISKRKVLINEKKPGNVEQLFIYFAGHGVNIHRHEYWLLSGADKVLSR